MVPGSTNIGELNERFGLNVPEDDYTTIGGYIFGALGRLPVVGDRTTAGGAVFTVREMDGRRIESLAVDLHSAGDRRGEATRPRAGAPGAVTTAGYCSAAAACSRSASCQAFTAMIVAACATSAGTVCVVVVDLRVMGVVVAAGKLIVVESRNAELHERQMVGARLIPDRTTSGPRLRQRLQHRLPHVAKLVAALQGHAGDAARSVVEHEHRLQLVELGLVGGGIGLRAEQAFLFGAEQHETDRALAGARRPH